MRDSEINLLRALAALAGSAMVLFGIVWGTIIMLVIIVTNMSEVELAQNMVFLVLVFIFGKLLRGWGYRYKDLVDPHKAFENGRRPASSGNDFGR